ncbi:hypothetical protein BDK88_1496 [Natrinema hispanicum]|uniref:Uncharacterized protein n=1 Tax=Natrinema hispanicum TaxID=392421 RepID=A0A482YCJ3_9EURY|nr:hypothetical protein [Natrinema hispanicum]RZV10341.1 hypothetical protein BDK88_1496 [Natrinema hispanicum]
MSAVFLQEKIPRFAVPAIIVLLAGSLLYSVFVTAQIFAWLVFWGGLFLIGLSLFVVYLLYRLVLAVERIADSQ